MNFFHRTGKKNAIKMLITTTAKYYGINTYVSPFTSIFTVLWDLLQSHYSDDIIAYVSNFSHSGISCKYGRWQRSEYYWIYSLTDECHSPKEKEYTPRRKSHIF